MNLLNNNQFLFQKDDNEALLLCSIINIIAQKFKPAIALLTECIKRMPEHKLRLYEMRSNCYIGIGNYDFSINDLNSVLELNPNYNHAYLIKGSILNILGNLNGAYENFLKFIELSHPDNRFLYEIYYRYSFLCF